LVSGWGHSTKEPLCIARRMGDFNARLHGVLSTEPGVVGRHVYGGGLRTTERPERGDLERTSRDLLIELCKSRGLLTMSTWFRHTDASMVTCMAPGVPKAPAVRDGWNPTKYGQVDFCLASERWKTIVQDVRSNTGAGLPTDHFPVEARVRIRLAARDRGNERPDGWDFGAATEEQKKMYDEAVARSLLNIEGAPNVEAAWKELEQSVKTSLEASMPMRRARPRRPRTSEEAMDMMACRRALARQGMENDARELDKMVRAQV